MAMILEQVTLDTMLLLLILINTLVLIFGVGAVSLMLIKMMTQINAMADFEISLAELTKVIEQQTRLIEFIGRKVATK
jgi:hypothetical protein